jgi:hypothetical protein
LGDALKDKLSRIPQDVKAQWKLTADQKFLCKRTGLDLPFLPVDTTEEIRLFNKLALEHFETNGNKKTFNYESMAIAWCEHVDGLTVFPKLPVYLRNYQPSMDVNIFIKDSLKAFADRDKEISHVMSATSSLIPPSSNGLSLSKKTSSGDEDIMDSAAAANVSSFFNVDSPSAKVASRTNYASAIHHVSTVPISSQSEAESSEHKKYKVRAGRTCTHCRDVLKEFERANTCDGRIGNKICPYKSPEVTSNTAEMNTEI